MVTADVECRFVGLMDAAFCFAVDASAELRSIVTDDVDARFTVTGDSGIRVTTAVVDVRL